MRLRAIEGKDLETLHAWANDPAIQGMLGGWHFPTSTRDQQEWLEGLSRQSSNQRFAIEVAEFGLIGQANLVSIDWKNGNAFHGMLLGNKDVRGRGFARDTVMAIMRYAFDELGLSRLDSDIVDYNAASLGLYTEKCGWAIEGRKPGWHFRRGRRWDKIIVGITRDQYRSMADSNGDWTES